MGERPPAGVVVEERGAARWLVLDRTDRLNAVTTETLTALADAVERSALDPAVRVIVLTGAGRAFSAGVDLRDPVAVPGADTVDAANRLVLGLREAPQPVVAAVNGAAVGVGCSIALAADLVIARESAYFLLAFANVGLMPDGGATALVAAAIGRARATRMAMLAERVPASTAFDWGLISAAVPDDEFDDRVEDWVGRLAAGPPLAYARTKRALTRTTLPRLSDALAVEREGQTALLASADFAEGTRAFRDRRAAVFTGH